MNHQASIPQFAHDAYEALCRHLDENEIAHKRHPEELSVLLGVPTPFGPVHGCLQIFTSFPMLRIGAMPRFSVPDFRRAAMLELLNLLNCGANSCTWLLEPGSGDVMLTCANLFPEECLHDELIQGSISLVVNGLRPALPAIWDVAFNGIEPEVALQRLITAKNREETPAPPPHDTAPADEDSTDSRHEDRVAALLAEFGAPTPPEVGRN